MELKLAENIRFFRKNKKMTQEQLAESLGVTVGAVSKWESAMTTPEISMIMRLAEFFDTSMDVLVGYHLQNKSLPQIMEQLKELRQQKEYDDAISLGEKALQKYPNYFDLVYETALCYLSKCSSKQGREASGRCIELLQRSKELIDQNEQPEITSWLIKNQMGEAYVYARKHEQAVAIFKENNINGINDSRIAQQLSDVLKRDDEAAEYIERAHRKLLEELLAVGSTLPGFGEKKWGLEHGKQCLYWILAVMESLQPEQGVCVTDQALVNTYQFTAEVSLNLGDRESAKGYLIKAFRLADKVDSTPIDEVIESRLLPLHRSESFFWDEAGSAHQMMQNRLNWNTREQEPDYYALWDEVCAELKQE